MSNIINDYGKLVYVHALYYLPSFENLKDLLDKFKIFIFVF